MPNWCEGKLKIRGNRENIVRFIEEGLICIENDKETEKLTQIEVFADGSMNIKINKRSGSEVNWLWIKNSQRNFIDLDDEISIKESREPNKYITILNLRGAWDIDVQALLKLSGKFKLSFKAYCFESGACFNKDIIITNGRLVKNQIIEFEDYEWECIDPTIGG